MMNLLEKIEMLVEKEAERKGIYFPSNESVTITLELNNEEMDQFRDLDLSDNYHFEIEGNTVTITYSQPDEIV